MIKFDNVCKRYENGHQALQSVSFNLESGELAFLTGHSGAGKSTLLKLINGIDRPCRGQVLVNNILVNDLSERRIPYLRRIIGSIFQDHRLLTDRTVFDNVALPLIITGFRQQDIRKRVRAALDKVGLLPKEKCYPISLSGGEQQRVGIARAVVHKPSIILADEPTGNLDPTLSQEIMHLFNQFNQVGVTTLIATHNTNLIDHGAHRVIQLKHGTLINEEHYA